MNDPSIFAKARILFRSISHVCIVVTSLSLVSRPRIRSIWPRVVAVVLIIRASLVVVADVAVVAIPGKIPNRYYKIPKKMIIIIFRNSGATQPKQCHKPQSTTSRDACTRQGPRLHSPPPDMVEANKNITCVFFHVPCNSLDPGRRHIQQLFRTCLLEPSGEDSLPCLRNRNPITHGL
jgi:hypothetical protein